MIELAMIVAFLGVPLLLGTAQIGLFVYDSIEIANAAHAGAAYGMQSLTLAANTAGIITAAQAEATDFGTALTVTPTTYYACSNALGGTRYTGSSAQTNATAACTGTGVRALQFVMVVASTTITSPIRCPGLPISYTMSSTSIMEVEK